ncbi:F-box/kelch-repeat protein At3g06240-like [Spinacia oleracea]|uniref:F-box/kelch-repeat protein At3g06240-like n=1 Tax=Spinacia oleracea TaxID=3562 RepID=A0ABM3QLU2_SPIOL|nr:F-box/kelch-repeat protein At3g06240-like [Spinacia oleracea]
MIRFSLYNPVTGNFSNIPDLTPGYAYYSWDSIIGFGYDSKSDDYKIFCSVPQKERDIDDYNKPIKSWVYSSKNNSWRIIQPPPPHHRCGFKPKMVLYNNALHWLVGNNIIFSFDLATEEYDQISQPNYDSNDKVFHSRELANLRGYLHLVEYNITYENDPPEIHEYVMRIWAMGSNQSWVKLIHCLSLKQVVEREMKRHRTLGKKVLTYHYPFMYSPPLPYAYSENEDEILMVLGGRTFVNCDVRSGELKRVESCSLPDGWKDPGYLYDVIPWIGSFVLPSTSRLCL